MWCGLLQDVARGLTFLHDRKVSLLPDSEQGLI